MTTAPSPPSLTTPLSPPNLKTFEEDYPTHGGLADRVKLALDVPYTRDKVVNYYSKLLRWPTDHKRAAKEAATDLFDKLSSLESPSDHLAHLLAALTRTGSDGALVQDIENATGIFRRAEKDSANNDGLHYYNVRLLQQCALLDEKQTAFFFLFFFFFFLIRQVPHQTAPAVRVLFKDVHCECIKIVVLDFSDTCYSNRYCHFGRVTRM
jgi:hypothetical protein